MKYTAADRRWSRAVREAAGYQCQRCGTQHESNSQGLHACHIFSRGIKRTRTDLANALCCCYGCHRVIDSCSEEKETVARSVLGDEEFEALMLRAGQPLKRVEAST